MPIMSLPTVEGATKREFDLLPKDVYQVEVMDVESIQEKAYQSDEIVDKFKFTFVIIEDGKYYGRRLWKNTTTKFSGGKKPTGLFQVLSGVLQKEFSKEESENPASWMTLEFFNSLIGRQVRLSISHKTSEETGKTKEVIESYLPVKTQLPAYSKEKKAGVAPVDAPIAGDEFAKGVPDTQPEF